MKIGIGISDDYAAVNAEGVKSWENDNSKVSFYYGYEVTENDDEDGEWMFVARQNGEVLKAYTTSQIESSTSDNLGDMSEYLIAGIYMYINEL